MSFLRRNKKDGGDSDKPAAEPPAMAVQASLPAQPTDAEEAPQEKQSGSRNPIAGIRQWIIDSYNGLYKIVLKPSMPTISFVLLFVVGIAVGLFWAYMVSPTIWLNANPHRLRPEAQDEWIKMTAAAYESGFYNDEAARTQLSRVDDPAAAIERMLNGATASDQAVLTAIQPIAQEVAGTPSPQPAGFISEMVSLLVPLILFAILTPIVVLIWRLLFYPNIIEPIRKQVRLRTDADYRKQQEELRVQQEQARRQKQMLKDLKNQEADQELGAPVMTQLSIFNRERNYDDSFEIELPLDRGGDFLGQCGVAIDEAVDPTPAAMEVWLFDMFAPPAEQNKKAVLVSPAANNDPGIRGRLEGDVDNPATDIVVAGPGATVRIDSQNLVLEARLLSLEMGPDGHFGEYEMQVQAWQKGADAAPAAPPPAPVPAAVPPPAGGRSMDDYADMQFDPPPPMPSGSAPAPPPPAGGRSMDDYANMQFDPPPPMPDEATQQHPPSPPPPAGGRSLSDYDDIQFDPPPPMPDEATQQHPSAPPPPGGVQPLQPPPLQYPPGMEPSGDDSDDEDDPFGGTGDFTPLSHR